MGRDIDKPGASGGPGGGGKKNQCKKCGYEGNLRDEGLCGKCDEETKHTDEECGGCKKTVRKRDRGLGCEVCEQWFHIGCEKVTVAQYEFLIQEENKSIPWSCRKCRGNLKQYAKKMNRILAENNELKERIEKLEEGIIAVKEQIKEEVLTHVFEEFEERREREEKKNNIVVFNVEEKNCESREEKIREELSLSVQLLKETGMDIKDEDIVEVHRIGRQKQGQGDTESQESRRPRPLLIKLQDTKLKWEIIRNGKKIKDSRIEHLKRAVIVPDQTHKEREKNRKLREELKAKRDNGEEGWYIRKGQLVRNSFF